MADRDRRASLPYLAAVASTLWLFRDLRHGQLLGDVGDARWTIAFHEHWFDVWRGRAGVRELLSYAPRSNMLGSTDPLFVQGQFYSFARLTGFGYIAAWVIAQMTTVLIGAIGVAALARRFLATWWGQVAVVPLCCLSYPLILQSGHIQLLAFMWLAWIVLAAHNVATGRARRASWWVLCVLPPIIAISSWYVIALGAFAAAAWCLVCAAIGLASRRGVAQFLSRAAHVVLLDRWMLAGTAAAVLGWLVVAWIFLPGSRALPPVVWGDALPYLPQWSDLVNASGQGGGMWSPLYRAWFPEANAVNNERREGFGPALLISLGVVLICSLRRAIGTTHAGKKRQAMWRLSIALTCVLFPLLFLTSVDGWSIYKPVFLWVPGVDSVRAPFRGQAITYALASFLVVAALEHWAGTRPGDRSGHRVVRTAAAGVLVITLIAESNRQPFAHWEADGLLAADLRQWVATVEADCDAIVVPYEAGAPSVAAIDAVILAMFTGVATPQGHGRADPSGSPGSTATPEALAAWMRSLGFDGDVCAVRPSGVQVVVASDGVSPG